VFHAVSLFDQVTVEPAGDDAVTVTGEGADRVPADQDNLALRAIVALRAAVQDRDTGAGAVHVTIAKRIPVAAGLAGGSADAAAALVACNELWAAGLTQQQLRGIGADLHAWVKAAEFDRSHWFGRSPAWKRLPGTLRKRWSPLHGMRS